MPLICLGFSVTATLPSWRLFCWLLPCYWPLWLLVLPSRPPHHRAHTTPPHPDMADRDTSPHGSCATRRVTPQPQCVNNTPHSTSFGQAQQKTLWCVFAYSVGLSSGTSSWHMSLMRAVLSTLSGPVVVDSEGDAFTLPSTQRERERERERVEAPGFRPCHAFPNEGREGGLPVGV